MNGTAHNPAVNAQNLATMPTPPVAASFEQPLNLGALASLRVHWPEYLMEAGLLGAFMVSACVFGALYEFPRSPVHQAITSGFLRRVLMGVSMGLTAIAIIYSPWGKQSGAHINPSVTFTFFRLGKIKFWRNHEWTHLYNADVISMPDKWEYPWYAAWDLAFHCIPLALVDSDFAKEQLTLMLREWYMHPNGPIPAYEWAFGDVNPPVHAWASWRVYKIDKKRKGKGDRAFLQRVFHKLMLNFTWWVNRKDADGMNIFQGGFLGLDNIGVFDRSAPLPTGGYIEQSDGTSWMAMYTLNLLAIALELAKEEPCYEDMASKFWEHFIYIANAMSHRGHDSMGLWNEEDGFFYDVLKLPDGNQFPMKIRSMVGLIPLFAVETLEPEVLDKLPDFKRRLEWFIDNRPDLTENLACMRTQGKAERRLLSIANRDQLRSILKFMLDEREFLSPYGIRALSQFHRDNPYKLTANGMEHRVDYEPGESSTGLFGGNSNWRGPIWFPVNYLLVESLQKFHHYLGDDFKVEFPTGSGKMKTLWEVAGELSRRMTNIFLQDERGRRPVFGNLEKFQTDPHWRDLVLFHEYFHGDSGAGVGASHQTGWTGVVTKLMQQSGESRERKNTEPALAAD